MPLVPRAFVYAFAMAALTVPVAGGQTLSASDTPAYISVVEGTATIDREDQSQAAVANMPLVAGDRLTTDQGRLEILYPDGSSLALDERSAVELQAPTLLRVMSGRIRLVVTGATTPSSAAHFQIDTPSASATTDGPGDYRISVQEAAGPQTEFAVLRGAGALMTERASTALRAGQRSVASPDAAPSGPQPFNSARLDAFDQWDAATRDARRGSGASAQYLPADLRIYSGTLDGGGSWQNQAPYGDVWYPAVAEDWRPYYNGYWSTVPAYGWTWIGADAWAWPTHHYGRWGQSGSRWFWIPDNRWGAAWVSWGAAPGYVSWSPLGFDNRPVLGPRGASSQAGWVVVPRRDFGRGRSVHQYAVPPRSLPATAAFVVQAAPPVPPGRGIPRVNGAAGVDGNRTRTGPGRSGASARPNAVPPAAMPAPAPGGVPRGTMAPVPQGTMAPVPQGTMAPVPRGTMTPVPQGTPPPNGSAQPGNPAIQPPARSGYPRRGPVAAPVAPVQPITAPAPSAPARAPSTIPAPAGTPQPAGRPVPAPPTAVRPAPPVRSTPAAPPAPARVVPVQPPPPAASHPSAPPPPAAPPAKAAPAAPAAATPPAAAPRRAAPAAPAASPAPATPRAPARTATPPPTRQHRDPPPPQ